MPPPQRQRIAATVRASANRGKLKRRERSLHDVQKRNALFPVSQHQAVEPCDAI